MAKDFSKAAAAPSPASQLAASRPTAPAATPAPTPSGAIVLEGRPVVSAALSGEVRKPRLPVEPRFWLCVHAKDWSIVEVDGKPVWAPEVRKVPQIAGVNGIRHTKTGLDTSHTRTKMSDNGWIFIPENPPYLREIEAEGGTTYVDAWTRVRAYPDGSVEVSRDEVAFNRWRVSLVEKGIIEPIRPSVIARLKRIQEKRWGRHVDQAHIPSRQVTIEKAQQEIERIEEAQSPSPATQHAAADRELERARAAADEALAQAIAAEAETARLRAELDLLRAQKEPSDGG